MIPRRIVIRNFLSYRQCELDLTGLRLAVLCGRNGDGKSALLDAMTWAVWGEARGKGDALIHASKEEMLVRFDFEANGEHYEVVRKKTRNGSAQLDFFHHAELGRKSLTGAGIRETEKEIVARVRMDYDTFANSAFVAQGHAGEFTAKGPKERKEVFRKILGLERYEELARAALDKRKTADVDLRALRLRVGEVEAAIARLPHLREEIQAVVESIEGLAPKVEVAQQQAMTLESLAADFDRVRRAAEDAGASLDRANRDLAGDERELAEISARLAEAGAALATAAQVEAEHAALMAAREEETRLAALQNQANLLERDADRADAEVTNERTTIETRVVSLRREVDGFASEAGQRAALAQRQVEIAREETALGQLRAGADAQREEAAHVGQARALAEKEINDLRALNKESHQRSDELLALQERGAAAECPTCRQRLSQQDIRHILDGYSAERRQLGLRNAEAKSALERASAALATLEEESAKVIDDCSRRDTAIQAAARQLAAALARVEDAERALPGRQAEIAVLETQLASGGFAGEARERAGKARRELAALRYDATAHQQAREEAARLQPAQARMRELDRARTVAASLQPGRDRLLEGLPAREAERDRAVEVAAKAQADLVSASDVGPQLREAQSELTSLRDEQMALHARRGGLEKERDLLVAREGQLEDEQRKAAALGDETTIYGILGAAFGRDGVQAMLIEQSLPRVEFWANELLLRMTDGRINVHLSTQREGKGGAIQETLDIRISDEAGIRDYEMFSGGEAFRVDFALRIALAKLLAERAGADLPTLIIDEGFGSQDADGIDRLVEAIQAVSEDFRLILVVTHVDALRDRFEQRIEVTKDPTRGSLARVV